MAIEDHIDAKHHHRRQDEPPHLSQYRITRRSLAVLLPSLTQQQDHTHSSRKEDRRLTKSVKCPVIQYHSGYGIDRACFFHAFFQISLRYLVDCRGFRVPKPRHGKNYQQQGKHQHHGHTYGQNTVDMHQLFQCAWPVPPLSTTRSDRSLFHDGMMAWYRRLRDPFCRSLPHPHQPVGTEIHGLVGVNIF